MPAQTAKLKKNVEGYTDPFGIFHPIRRGVKEQGELYDPGLAGDYDDVFDREIRKSKNQQKAEVIWEKRQLEDALEGALGEESKTSLSQFVRRSGGLKYDEKTTDRAERGELRRLSFKESGKRGIAHKNGRYSPDKMREAADEAGYTGLGGDPLRSVDDFLQALEADLYGRKKIIYPLGSIGAYKFNPKQNDAAKWARYASQLLRLIKLLKRRGKTAKAKKLEKARKHALKLAQLAKQGQSMKANPVKTKKRKAAKKVSKPKTRKARKTAKPKKNGLLETLSTAAVGLSAGLNVFDRLKEKKRTPPAEGKSSVIRASSDDDLKENKTKKVVKANKAKKANKPNKAKKANKPYKANKTNKGSEAYHEKQFNSALAAIENGDFSKVNSAKLHGKLSGLSKNEFETLIHKARLTYRLKKNPKAKKATKKAKKNPISETFKRYGRGHKFAPKTEIEADGKRGFIFASLPTKDLKYRIVFYDTTIKDIPEAKLKILDEKAKKNPATAKAFSEFQGRPSTKELELVAPSDAPKHLYALGKLLELHLKGQPDIDFRRETTGKTFYLCADGKNNQLWIAGGRVAEPDNSIKKGFSEPYATITHVVYETQKNHLDDRKQTGYIHKFGDDGGEKPLLAFDAEGFPIIVGGSYTITPLGIAD